MALLLSGSVKNKTSPTGYTNLTQVQFSLGNSPSTGTGYTLVTINGISTWSNSLGNLSFENGVITSQSPTGDITINPSGTGTVTINGPVNIPSLTTNLKIPVQAATTANVDIFAAPSVVDGITLVAGNRVLVRAQTTATTNGIYYVTIAGTGTNDSVWLRTVDANSSTSLAGAILNVGGGDTYGGRYFFTDFKKGQELGVDPVNWYQFVADTLAQDITSKNIDASPIGMKIAAEGSFTNLLVGSSTSATSTNTGALQVRGGAGIAGDLWLGGALYFSNASGSFRAQRIEVLGSDTSYNSTTGALVVTGGVGVGGNVNIGSLTSATSSLTGALTVAGGLGVGGDVYANHYYSNGVPLNNIYWNGGVISSQFTVNNPAQSVSTTTGAVVVQGGVGIGGDLYVGKSITLESGKTNEYVYFRMRNTATNGQSFTWDVGGNNRAGTAGTSLSEGSLTLYDDKNNAYRLAVSKATGNLLLGKNTDNGVDKLQVGGSLSIQDSQMATRVTVINTGTATTVIDSFPLANYRTTKMFVQITDGVGPYAAFHVVEMMILIDNIGQTYLSQYGIVTTQGERGSFDVDYNTAGNGLVRLLFTPSNAPTQKTIKVLRTSISG
jgi:hypothetical protein